MMRALGFDVILAAELDEFGKGRGKCSEERILRCCKFLADGVVCGILRTKETRIRQRFERSYKKAIRTATKAQSVGSIINLPVALSTS